MDDLFATITSIVGIVIMLLCLLFLFWRFLDSVHNIFYKKIPLPTNISSYKIRYLGAKPGSATDIAHADQYTEALKETFLDNGFDVEVSIAEFDSNLGVMVYTIDFKNHKVSDALVELITTAAIEKLGCKRNGKENDYKGKDTEDS